MEVSNKTPAELSRVAAQLPSFYAEEPEPNVNKAKILLALLPIFTQNLIFVRCSRFLHSFFSQQYTYHGHVLHVLHLMLGSE
jgi:hypothetical protein